MVDLTELGVADLLEHYARRAISPREVVAAALRRIEDAEPYVDAFVTLRPEPCLDGAAEAERRWSRGCARALEGVPVGIKDVIATEGMVTAGGSRIYAGNVPGEDASVVARLRAAGALVLGKLQTTEFGGGRPSFANPWDLTRTASGSSAGPAIALAARELPLAVGTDAGGSIRGPAAFCGVAGLKPSYGRVSRHGVMPISWTLDHVGPMARTAHDLAIALGVVAGHDPRDAGSSRAPVPDYAAALARGVAGVRLGIPADWFFDVCDPEVERNVRTAVAALEQAGARVKEVRLPTARDHDVSALSWFILAPELSSLHEEHLARLSEFSPDFRQRVLEGRLVSAVDYLRALRLRRVVREEYETIFAEVDALITPGAACVAPLNTDPLEAEIGGRRHPLVDVQGRIYHPFNVTGLPALCVPCGLDRQGLPTSMQIVAAPFAEATCLRVAHALQELSDSLLRPPPFDARPANTASSRAVPTSRASKLAAKLMRR